MGTNINKQLSAGLFFRLVKLFTGYRHSTLHTPHSRLFTPLHQITGITLFCLALAFTEKPNVIIVFTDDQGYGDLSFHGNPELKTPHLDALAKQSLRLTQFHGAPMCTPSRSQLLTGRDALVNGATGACSGRTFMRTDLPTMGEVFKDNGYATAVFGKWHLGDNYPHRAQDRGFDEVLIHKGWGITSTPDHWNNDYFDDYFWHNGKLKQYKGYCNDVWFREAGKWIKRQKQKGKPFLAYIATNTPHGPFWVEEKYRKPYKHLAPKAASFFGMMANLDESMGALDKLLMKEGLVENTIVMYMSDNGGTGGVDVYNAGMRGHKMSLYDGGHRLIGFLRWPGGKLRKPGDIEELTQIQDILPTLVNLTGIKKAENLIFDGTDLTPLLKGKPLPVLKERMLVVQYSPLNKAQPAKWDAAVLMNKWRLVKGKELYDISKDPGQKSDVASGNVNLVKKMRGHYEKWWKRAEPITRQYSRISIGSEKEPLTTLTSLDWLAPQLVVASHMHDVRQLGKSFWHKGRPEVLLNGFWNIFVEKDGEYQISLSRWPREAETPIAAGLPEFKGVDGTFPEGKSMPIVKAAVKIGGQHKTVPVKKKDHEARFKVKLKKGETKLQTWFYDKSEKELSGAFYTYVRRIPQERADKN